MYAVEIMHAVDITQPLIILQKYCSHCNAIMTSRAIIQGLFFVDPCSLSAFADMVACMTDARVCKQSSELYLNLSLEAERGHCLLGHACMHINNKGGRK
jgi:hypothetical protein